MATHAPTSRRVRGNEILQTRTLHSQKTNGLESPRPPLTVFNENLVDAGPDGELLQLFDMSRRG